MPEASSTIDRKICEAAHAQLGLVTSAQLAALGVGSSGRKHRADGGWLTRVVRGVYIVGDPVLSQPALDLAGVLHVRRGGVVGGVAAAVARDLLHTARGKTTTHRRGHRRPQLLRTEVPMDVGGFGLIRIDEGTYRDDEFDVVGGRPVAGTPRLLVDLAAQDQKLFERAWERAEYLRTLDTAAIRRQLAQGWRPGTAAVRAHLESFRALDLGDHGVDSLAELRAIRLVVEAGAPEPLVNHPVTTPSGDKRLDLYFLFAGVVVEIDGWKGHGTRTAFEQDRLRDAEVLALGLITTRYSATRLEAEPEACAAEILDLVLRRMRERAILEAAG